MIPEPSWRNGLKTDLSGGQSYRHHPSPRNNRHEHVIPTSAEGTIALSFLSWNLPHLLRSSSPGPSTQWLMSPSRAVCILAAAANWITHATQWPLPSAIDVTSAAVVQVAPSSPGDQDRGLQRPLFGPSHQTRSVRPRRLATPARGERERRFRARRILGNQDQALAGSDSQRAGRRGPGVGQRGITTIAADPARRKPPISRSGGAPSRRRRRGRRRWS